MRESSHHHEETRDKWSSVVQPCVERLPLEGLVDWIANGGDLDVYWELFNPKGWTMLFTGLQKQKSASAVTPLPTPSHARP